MTDGLSEIALSERVPRLRVENPKNNYEWHVVTDDGTLLGIQPTQPQAVAFMEGYEAAMVEARRDA